MEGNDDKDSLDRLDVAPTGLTKDAIRALLEAAENPAPPPPKLVAAAKRHLRRKSGDK